MRDFGKVAPTFWTGETGRQLRGLGRDEQLLALFLITAPCSNMIGLYTLPLPMVGHYLGMTDKHTREVLRRVIETGFCDYDWDREIVYVPRMAEHQVSRQLHPRDKRVTAVRRTWEAFRKSPFFRVFHEQYREAFHLPDLSETDAGEQLPLPGLDVEEADDPAEEDFTLPEILATDGFRDAWQEWLRYRRERRLSRPKGISLKKAWNRLAEMGPERAVAAIHHSITQGWQGIFEPKHERTNDTERSSRIRAEPDKYEQLATVCPADETNATTVLADAQGP